MKRGVCTCLLGEEEKEGRWEMGEERRMKKEERGMSPRWRGRGGEMGDERREKETREE